MEHIMATTPFALSDIELACGVTLDAVRTARARAMVHMTADGMRVVMDDASPALCGAVARMALGVAGKPLGRNAAGFRVYAPDADAI